MRLMWSRLQRLCLGLLIGWASLMYSNGYAQAACAEALASAESQYLEGRFDDAIRQLQACLEDAQLDAEAAIPVYRLLSLSFIQKGDLSQARRAVVDLFSVAPAYQADPIQDPPSYTSLVDLVRTQVQVVPEPDPTPPMDEEQPVADVPPPVPVGQPEERQRDDRWWLSGIRNVLVTAGGAAVVVVATALAFGGGSSN